MPISEEQIDQSVSPINQEIIDDLYDKYCADPMNLPEDWRNYFSALEAQQAQIKQVTPQEPTSPKNENSQIAVTGRDVTRSDLLSRGGSGTLYLKSAIAGVVSRNEGC